SSYCRAWLPTRNNRPAAMHKPAAGIREAARASHPVRHRLRISALQVAVARERPQREEFPVAVVAQVEHARETSRGVKLLVPQPVRALRARKIIDAARDRRMIDLARRHQAEQRPGGL